MKKKNDTEKKLLKFCKLVLAKMSLSEREYYLKKSGFDKVEANQIFVSKTRKKSPQKIEKFYCEQDSLF
jgi:hypothetical protein